MTTDQGAKPVSAYMLLFRGTGWDKPLSPEEIKEVMTRWYAWMDRLSQQRKIKGGQALDRYEGKLVSGKGGKTVADGPFAGKKQLAVISCWKPAALRKQWRSPNNAPLSNTVWRWKSVGLPSSARPFNA